MKGQKQVKQEPARDEFGRIDVPVFPPNTPGNPSLDIIRLEMVGGKRADTDPQVAPVSDINNFVMLPDGSGMRIRDGYEYNERYSSVTSPVGRQSYMIETAPPGVGLGYRHQIMNTSGKMPYIVDAEYVRDRTQSFGVGGLAEISWLNTEQTVTGPYPSNPLVQVNRGGRMTGNVNFMYKTVDGTAIGGVDYSSVDTTGVSTAGGILFVGLSINSGAIGKYFYVQIYQISQGAVIEEPSIIRISCVA